MKNVQFEAESRRNKIKKVSQSSFPTDRIIHKDPGDEVMEYRGWYTDIDKHLITR